MVQAWTSGQYPCAVCRTGVGNNSIYCNGCKLWVHKKCSGLQRLTPNPDYRYARCMGNAHPQSEVQVRPDKLEVVASFCYLGDMLSAGGGCEIRVTTLWKQPENSGSYYQFIPLPLLQDLWPCIQLLHVERHAPCQ